MGFFDDPDTEPEAISLRDLAAAQQRYSEVLVDEVQDNTAPVLDIGCGMGGLSRLLRARGFEPVALTPDPTQAAHVGEALPGVEVICKRFERIPLGANRVRFGTIITSESFQYLHLDRALVRMRRVLRPGGRWILCDYFRATEEALRGGHRWEDFKRRLNETGWVIRSERDITPNVLPTFRYFRMWADRVILPFADYLTERLERKSPGWHYLLEPAHQDLRAVLNRTIDNIDPVRFADTKRYMLLVIERADADPGIATAL